VAALLAAALLALAFVAPRPARAAELLRGPFPFRSDNALSLDGGLGLGPGDTPSGARVRATYGYLLTGGLWFELQLGWLAGSCAPPDVRSDCSPGTGHIADVMAGLSWKMQTEIPLVPFARIAAGPMYFFPDASRNALGFGGRIGFGARYFLFESLGLGVDAAFTLGRAGYEAAARVSRTVAIIDLLAGVEVQF
jgi:hypothetical protein